MTFIADPDVRNQTQGFLGLLLRQTVSPHWRQQDVDTFPMKQIRGFT
jgi:hypothetical protein